MCALIHIYKICTVQFILEENDWSRPMFDNLAPLLLGSITLRSNYLPKHQWVKHSISAQWINVIN